MKNYRAADSVVLEKGILAIANKYKSPEVFWYSGTYSTRLIDQIQNRFHLDHVGRAMANIIERKNFFHEDTLPFFIRFHYYTTLVLCLLLFAFRHSTAKTFFLSLLTGVILTVLTALFMAFGGGVRMFFGMFLFYFLVFGLISFAALNDKTRDIPVGIALNLFLWLLPFMPLCAVAAYYEGSDYRYYDYQKELAAYKLAEWIGAGLLIVLLAVYLPRLYRRWYGAPE